LRLTLLFFCLFLIIPALVFGRDRGGASSLPEIRKQFYSAVEDREEAEKLYALLNSKSMSSAVSRDPVIKAYKGASETLLGKHYLNPYSKYKYLKSGLEIIAQSVRKDPSNLEIRFIRFSILHYIPSFLGYGEERNEDLKVIYNELKNRDYTRLSKKIQTGIIEFVIRSGRLTSEQESVMNNLLNEG